MVVAHWLKGKKRVRALVGVITLILGWVILVEALWRRLPYPALELGKQQQARLIAFSPSGTLLATAHATDEQNSGAEMRGPIVFWDVEGRTQRFAIGSELHEIGEIAFSKNWEWLAVHDRKQGFSIWDLKANPPRMHSKIADAVGRHSCGFSPDSMVLFTHCWESGDWPLKLWYVPTMSELGAIQARPWKLTFSEDGKALATWGCAEKGDRLAGKGALSKPQVVRLWSIDPKSRNPVSLKHQHNLFGEALYASPDEGVFVYAIDRRDEKKNVLQLYFCNLVTGQEIDTLLIKRTDGHSYTATLVAGGHRLVIQNTEGVDSSQFDCYDIKNKPIQLIASNLVAPPCISADGRLVMVATQDKSSRKNYKVLKLQDKRVGSMRGNKVCLLSISNEFGENPALMFSPDNRFFVVIPSWMSNTTYIAREKAPGLLGWLNDVLGIYSDGLPYAASSRNTVLLWRLRGGSAPIPFKDSRQALFSPDGKYLAILDLNSHIKLLVIPPRKPIWMFVGISVLYWVSVYFIKSRFPWCGRKNE
jgi:WD40 repeat protein